jgi:hypothetical protein
MNAFLRVWQYLTEFFWEWEMFYVQLLFFENHAVYEIMSKNVVEPEGPKITSQYGAYKLRAG